MGAPGGEGEGGTCGKCTVELLGLQVPQATVGSAAGLTH